MTAVREAQPSDLPSICALGEEVNALHHAAFPDIFAGRGASDAAASHWKGSVAQANATTFVAEHEGTIVGFVTVAVSDEAHPLLQPVRVGRVGSIGVTESVRGRGVGSELMRHAQAWLERRGAYEVRLNVWQFNGGALRLYKRLGFEVRSVHLAKRLGEA